MENPQLEDKNSSWHGCGPQKVAKKIWCLHHIGNRQHDDIQMRGVWARIYPSCMKKKMTRKRGVTLLNREREGGGGEKQDTFPELLRSQKFSV